MSGDKSKPMLECLNDTATGEDSLGFQPYVEAIAEFLTAEGTRPPITLSIEGQWGCGKSSFMRQLQKEINKKNEAGKEPKYFTVWFNSWKYDKEDELWASFALNFMDELSTQLSWKRLQHSRLKLLGLRYKLKLKSNFLIIVHFLWNILSFILIFSFLSLLTTYVLNSLGMPLPDYIDKELTKNFTNIVLILTPLVGLMNYFSTEKWFIDVFRDPFGLKKLESNTNYKERLSFREHFHSDFNEIIKSYIGDSKVYVFIDDLDRCEVPIAAELMQAINLMISDNSKVYFSLGMDRKIISAGLAAKNEQILKYLGTDVSEHDKGLEYGYDFIEKFIQLPFKVPSPKSADFLKFFTSIDENESSPSPSESADKSSISEDFTSDKSHEGDIKASQNETNGQETGTDASNNGTDSSMQEIQNDKDCLEDPETSKLILEMVAPALDNNPRRIKQFINQFRFQRTLGKRTGLFSYKEGTAPESMWNCKKLAKFVTISIKWNSIISALNSNRTLLTRLQEYALKPENEDKNLEKWVRDERLIELLRYGCVEESNLSQNAAEYTLLGLDLSKLLQVSPVIVYPEESMFGFSLSGIGEIIPKTFISPSTSMEFLLISAGSFSMGSPSDEEGGHDDENPVHKVTIKNSFYLGKCPVTQRQWVAVMGDNPSSFKGNDLPVESVSWDDVQDFIKKLNEMEGTDKYRLPSEAEWEYACRAGTTTRYFFGDDKSKLNEYAWYDENSGSETHPVGQKKPNPRGLYDIHGNVWEWTQDRWHDNYKGAPSDSSAWEKGNNSDHVSRGGSWHSDALRCRSAYRLKYFSDVHYRIGFRLLRKL